MCEAPRVDNTVWGWIIFGGAPLQLWHVEAFTFFCMSKTIRKLPLVGGSWGGGAKEQPS